MKTRYSLYLVLVLGFAAFASAMGQKTSKEYDDMYYIPSDKKSVQSAEKQETVKSDASTEGLTDYEKYINSLDKQNLQKTEIEYTSDSLEYAQDPNYIGGEYYEKDGNTYITNNYYKGYDSNDNGYYPYSSGLSFGMSFGYPYMGFGMSYGWPGYSSWYSPYYDYYPYYGYGYYPYYGYPYWGYDSYYHGYNHGYYDGYYYGYNGGGMYYPDHRPVYYGPRRSIETNRMAEAMKTTAVNGRRVSTTGGGTSRVASGSNSSSGNRTMSSGNSISGRSTENNVTKSTRSAGTGYTERRPYGTAGVNSRTSNSSSERNYYTGTPGTRTAETPRTMGSYSAQERPVYTRPSSTTSQSRPSYSGSSGDVKNSTTRSLGSPSTSRPSTSSGSTYSRPSSSSGSTYSRSSSSSGSSYSRSSSSSGSFSSGGSRSVSSGSSGSVSRSGSSSPSRR